MLAEVREMFDHGYDNYMRYAFPKDELAPVTCTGVDTLSAPNGGLALTLVDALDTLALLGMRREFCTQSLWVARNLDLDLDLNISVFEVNIRVLGGLLSAHLMFEDAIVDPLECGYKGELLVLAYDLGERLLPAFDTPTGVPFGTVNLRHGVPPRESLLTSTAGGGSFLLEFGVLSALSDDIRFERAARGAVRGLWQRRSHLGLVGNHINITSGEWTHQDAGVGSNIDSFFEYLPKAFALFGDWEFWHLWTETLAGVRSHVYKEPWFVEVNMHSGVITWPLFNSLQAFYPGTLANAGDLDMAETAAKAMHAVWRRIGGLPEGFSLMQAHPQPGQHGYPLRPELPESLWQLYRATRDPRYLRMGADVVYALQQRTRTPCGYAVLQDVVTGELRDRQESFFLSETLKYLLLLFDDNHFVNMGEWVFNTEGHPFPIRAEFQTFLDRHYDRAEHKLRGTGASSSPYWPPRGAAARCPRRDWRRGLSVDGIEVE